MPSVTGLASPTRRNLVGGNQYLKWPVTPEFEPLVPTDHPRVTEPSMPACPRQQPAGTDVRISGQGPPARTGQCHHECDDDEHGAERDTGVATPRVLADRVSRVPGEERRQRACRLGEVRHTSHDGGDSDDEQDYRQDTPHQFMLRVPTTRHCPRIRQFRGPVPLFPVQSASAPHDSNRRPRLGDQQRDSRTIASSWRQTGRALPGHSGVVRSHRT